ncbi:MAG: PHP domain-containing protein [Paludibacteraceae bacterium]|nr:PHP domain-containing protein [Paludibacteraceae bacterium]
MNDGVYTEECTDRLTDCKKILIVKPDINYDASRDLKEMCLDTREVSFTYPKSGVDLVSEVYASGASFVLQIGKRLTRKIGFYEGMTEELEKDIFTNVEDKFFNYHHHDEYSWRDALETVGRYEKDTKKWKGLAGLLLAQNRKFMSVTNHGGIAGWIKQSQVCEETGIKPIFGMEAYYNNYRGDDPEKKKLNRSANHLILLAKNIEGYYNIIKIHNDAQLNGFYYSPRTCDEALKKFGKGIFATSACFAGELPELLMQDRVEEAKARYEFYKSCFDEFFIEIQLIEMKEQKELNRKLIKFAQEMGARISIGIDSHYLYPEQSETHELMMCIRQGRTIQDLQKEDDDTWKFTVKNLYYRNYDQLLELFKSGYVDSDGNQQDAYEDDVFTFDIFQQACQNTRWIAVNCEDYKVDKSIKLPKLYENSEEVLSEMAWKGFREHGFDKCQDSNTYTERLEYELDVICLAGWADYFLITEMIVDKAIELRGEWGTGIGRGCFVSWNRVITENKIPVFISDVKIGEFVYSHDGTLNEVIDKFIYDVKEELIEIETEDGRKINCTLNHRILVTRNQKEEWVEAQNLLEGDDIVDLF